MDIINNESTTRELPPQNLMYGMCRPLEAESSFCLGLSTRPASEVVPHYFVVMRFLEM